MTGNAFEPLPLFPLQTVLFPGGLLPLQIFEVRYLDLIGRCHREGKPFGVVSLLQGREVRGAPANDGSPPGDTADRFQTVGTMAHIVSLQRPQPGLMVIRCEGGQRFSLSHQEKLRHGLWIGTVAHVLPQDVAVPVPPDLQHVCQAFEELLAQWTIQSKLQSLSDAELPVQPPYQVQDCGWLANRWCELLPMAPIEKQQLMVLDNPLLRLELVADLLEKRHGLRPR
jgi:Lon protease-like protein